MRVISEEEAKVEDVRRRLRMVSLLSVLLTNAVFLAVWFLFMPELPLYVLALFVLLSLSIWYVVVQSKINNLGKKKK